MDCKMVRSIHKFTFITILFLSTYLTEIGGFYAKLSGETAEAVVNRFFGIFFAMFQSCNKNFK